MRQDSAGRSGDVTVRADETVIENVAFHVLAQATGVRWPDATRHLRLVDQSGRAGHHLNHPVDAVDETVARGRILVAEDAVRARATLAGMWLLW